jgi:hypothetical protein
MSKLPVYIKLTHFKPSPEEKEVNLYFSGSFSGPLWCLGPIGKVNLFVGATNSGKSRLMRYLVKKANFSLFKLDGYCEALMKCVPNVIQICESIKDVKIQIPGHHVSAFIRTDLPVSPFFNLGNKPDNPLKDRNGALIDFSKFYMSFKYHFVDSALEASRSDTKKLEERSKLLALICDALSALAEVERKNAADILRLKSEMLSLRSQLKAVDCEVKSLSGYYIPVFRSTHALRSGAAAFMSEAVSSEYGIKTDIIRNGQGLYGSIFQARNSTQDKRRNHDAFVEFLSENFFHGKKVEVTSVQSEAPYIAVSIDGIEFPINHVGDGIQALITIMYTLFEAPDNSFVFIEEPENSLHPGLQRVMLDTMLANENIKAKQLTIFMTTHSNHLVDLSVRNFEDISIFVFEKHFFQSEPREKFIVRGVNNNRLHAIASLEALNSSVVMANCSIWVEGPTDRKYIRAFLKIYWNKISANIPREDINFAFFEYGGSNLASYLVSQEEMPGQESEKIKLQFIANRVFLISDRDEKKEKKHNFWTAAQNEHFVYFITPGKEIENLIPLGILREVFPKILNADECVTVNAALKDYSISTGLGRFLDDALGTEKFSAESGTLKKYYKKRFADLVEKVIEMQIEKDPSVAWDLLDSNVRELIEKIYRFISTHNGWHR